MVALRVTLLDFLTQAELSPKALDRPGTYYLFDFNLILGTNLNH